MANSFDGRVVILDTNGATFPSTSTVGLSPFFFESVTFENTTAAAVDMSLIARNPADTTDTTLVAVTVPADNTVTVDVPHGFAHFFRATGAAATNRIFVHCR
jgi:dTDP-4-dehydrorhamnose 3,5-epimerase-like enzyme